MARFPKWNLDDLWCDEESPAAFAATRHRPALPPGGQAGDLPAVAEVLWESSRHPRSSESVAWLDVRSTDLEVFREEIAAFLVLRDLSPSPVSPHLDTLLRVKLPLTTFDPEPLVDTAQLTTALKDSGRWPSLRQRAESFLTLVRLSKIADLLPSEPGTLTRLVESEAAPQAVCSFLIRRALLDRFSGQAKGWPSWAWKLDHHPSVERFRRGEFIDPSERSCAAQRSATALLSWVESALAEDVPTLIRPKRSLTGTSPRDDTCWSTASPRRSLCSNPSMIRRCTRRPMRSSCDRPKGFANASDTTPTSSIVVLPLHSHRPHAFQSGKRIALRLLHDLLRTDRRLVGKRVWILVMDGMRYDTWDSVIRPLLTEHFEVVEGLDRAYFSLLPSKTDIADVDSSPPRSGKDWKNYFNSPTKDERILAARALGVAKHEVDTKVRFVTDAETTEARAKMGYSSDELRDVNVLIYPISDDWDITTTIPSPLSTRRSARSSSPSRAVVGSSTTSDGACSQGTSC